MASTFTFVLGMPFNNLNKSDYNQYYLHFVIFAALIHFNHIDIFTSLSLFGATALRIRVVIFIIQFSLFSFPFLRTLLTSLHSVFLFSSFFPSPPVSLHLFGFFFVCVRCYDSVTSVSNLELSCLCCALACASFRVVF